jgi:transaldolase
MVDEGLLGVTSNPTIFDKAISGSADYDEQIRQLVGQNPRMDIALMIRELMITDIQGACDVLMPVHERTSGRDGYVSVEVTPAKARNTQATIAEVGELWTRIGRRNLMVKIPATREGLPAVTHAISEGVNVNVTLIFSVVRYREVAAAYIAGIERRMNAGLDAGHVSSVASVFVSRIDTLVDDLLTKKDPGRYTHLRGRAAVANTKLIYQAYKQIFGSPQFRTLAARGGRPQRPLWGSTGTKNPAYSDLLYVEPLIGPDTVNTVPPQTYTAILDHAHVASRIEHDLREAQEVLHGVTEAGIDMTWVLEKLEADGVAAFEKSFDGLYKNLQQKRDAFASQVA